MASEVAGEDQEGITADEAATEVVAVGVVGDVVDEDVVNNEKRLLHAGRMKGRMDTLPPFKRKFVIPIKDRGLGIRPYIVSKHIIATR